MSLSSTDPSPLCPQLYELDADPKRKEFLDDLFSFMQKRGEHLPGQEGWVGAPQTLWLWTGTARTRSPLGATSWAWVITMPMFSGRKLRVHGG